MQEEASTGFYGRYEAALTAGIYQYTSLRNTERLMIYRMVVGVVLWTRGPFVYTGWWSDQWRT
jgi:hypothetical protein